MVFYHFGQYMVIGQYSWLQVKSSQTSLKEEFIGSRKGGGRAGLGPQTKSESSLSLSLHFAVWLRTLFLLMDFPPFFIISSGDHDHVAALASQPRIPIPRDSFSQALHTKS